MTADYEDLLNGNTEFMMFNHDYKQLANGQHPKYVIIACSDSREVPEIITNEPLGSIFDIRVAGNIIDEAAIGSIEYAVEHLGVKKIIMLAHTKCGAVTAAQQLLNNGSKPGINGSTSCLDKLVMNIYDKIAANPMNRTDLVSAIVDNAEQQLGILIEQSAVIREGLKHGLSVALALYSIETGVMKFIDADIPTGVHANKA